MQAPLQSGICAKLLRIHAIEAGDTGQTTENEILNQRLLRRVGGRDAIHIPQLPSRHAHGCHLPVAGHAPVRLLLLPWPPSPQSRPGPCVPDAHSGSRPQQREGHPGQPHAGSQRSHGRFHRAASRGPVSLRSSDRHKKRPAGSRCQARWALRRHWNNHPFSGV